MSTAPRSPSSGVATLKGLRRALLRAAIMSGSLAVLVVMVFGHGSERGFRYADGPAGVDDMMTGSINGSSRYVVSRSVLQPAGAMPCLHFPDGTRRGSC